jgi:Fe-S-cluster containining protein
MSYLPRNGVIMEREFECLRCGKCCGPFYLALMEVNSEDKKGLGEWITLHGCAVSKQLRDGKEILTARIPMDCGNLVRNDDGTTSCKDYGNRPIICKEYFCGILKKEKPIPKGDGVRVSDFIKFEIVDAKKEKQDEKKA